MSPPNRDFELDALAAAVTNRGDRGAFDELAAAMRPRLIALLRQRLRDDAEVQDVVQQTLLRWWEKREAYDASRPFVPWLLTIAARLAIDAQRAGARRRGHERAAGEARAAALQPWASQAVIQAECADGVWSAVRTTCNAETAEALWLFYGEGLSASEIGQVLGRPSGAVRVLLHRGRAALRGPIGRAGLSMEGGDHANEDERSTLADDDTATGPRRPMATRTESTTGVSS